MDSSSIFAPLGTALRHHTGKPLLYAVIDSVPHLIIDDHRWIFPAIWLARENGLLAKTPPLVSLDSHADLSSFDETIKGGALAQQPNSFALVTGLVHMHGYPPLDQSSVIDGNWLTAVLRLGWIERAVTIGLPDPDRSPEPPSVLECGRIDTHLFYGRKRWLKAEYTEWHRTIGWKLSEDRIKFDTPPNKICLSVDLDTFASEVPDKRGMRPWNNATLRKRLVTPYQKGLARGQCFRDAYDGLRSGAGVVVVAKESEMFGRRNSADRLLESFWKLMYGAAPSLSSLG